MSRTLARVLLSIAVVFSVAFVFGQVVVFVDWIPGLRGVGALLWAVFVAGVVLAAAWLAIWHPLVRWTRRRIFWTLVATFVSVLLAFGVFALNGMASHDAEAAVVLAGLCWTTLWLGATTLIWRETGVEAVKRAAQRFAGEIRCPKCGYNMRGLHEARCPECGTQYTLDELVGSVLPEPPRLDAG